MGYEGGDFTWKRKRGGSGHNSYQSMDAVEAEIDTADTGYLVTDKTGRQVYTMDSGKETGVVT